MRVTFSDVSDSAWKFAWRFPTCRIRPGNAQDAFRRVGFRLGICGAFSTTPENSFGVRRIFFDALDILPMLAGHRLPFRHLQNIFRHSGQPFLAFAKHFPML
jgi:hypothetical protein